MPREFDAIIIGSGQAGPSLAVKLCEAGRRVAIVERRYFGGTCVNTGCMPTKTMVASAYAAHLARRAADYGVAIAGPIGIDMKRVKARKDEVVANASRNVESWLRSTPLCTVLKGEARFVSTNEITVGNERLRAPQIFINVGGRPLVPDIPGIQDVEALTSDTVMDLESAPEHLIVLGGSYIGLEFAQMFRRFGAKVTVVEAADALIPREDDDISQTVFDILSAEAIDIRVRTSCTGIKKTPEGVAVRLQSKTGEGDEIFGSHLLLAIGRKPNTGELGLDAAGVEVDSRGFIKTNEYLQTSVPSIWALGDCNGRGAFTHTSYNEFEIVAANLLHGERRSVNERIVTYGLFIDPPLGRVGMTEREARASGRKLLQSKRPMSRVGRAVERGETLGFMKVLVDQDSQRILGAAILGVGGDEAIHCITATMYADAPYKTLQRAVQIHPTVSELIPTVLGGLAPLE